MAAEYDVVVDAAGMFDALRSAEIFEREGVEYARAVGRYLEQLDPVNTGDAFRTAYDMYASDEFPAEIIRMTYHASPEPPGSDGSVTVTVALANPDARNLFAAQRALVDVLREAETELAETPLRPRYVHLPNREIPETRIGADIETQDSSRTICRSSNP